MGDSLTPAEAPVHVLDGVQSLVEQSLLRQTEEPGGESRFQMLETIREYALEQLASSGEEQATRRRHAETTCTSPRSRSPHGPGRARWSGSIAWKPSTTTCERLSSGR